MHVKTKKITILELTTTYDKLNRPVETLIPLPGAQNIWTYFRSASSNEINSSVFTDSKFEVVFEINWRENVSTGMVILYNGIKYVINRIDGFEDNRNDLKIYASQYESNIQGGY